MDKITEIKELTNKLIEYSHCYYDLDNPIISDAEYDTLYARLVFLERDTGYSLSNSPTRNVQGSVLPYLNKVKHSVPMLSADKTTNIEDVEKFIGRKEVFISYKLDGGTVVVKYKHGQFIQALSRGNGLEGEDITHTARMIKNLPMCIPYYGDLEIRGEALIPWKYYNLLNTDGSLGHPRNVVTGALRQLDANKAAEKNIYFYAFTLVNWKDVDVEPTKFNTLRFLSDIGFDIVPGYSQSYYSGVNYYPELDRETYENPTDGWCFEYNDLIYGESLGSTGHHDRRLFALKPDIETYETTLKSIEWMMGKTGALTPTAIFEPTTIDNTIIERASVHNVSVMKALKMTIGATIEIYKANMIIPQVLKTIKDGETPIEIPKCCPICGGETSIVKENESEILMCTNPNCSGKLLGRLVHAVSKKALNIDGLSEATLEFLINKGWVSSVKSIYHLADHKLDWERSEGFGKTSVNNILTAIEKSRNIDLQHFIVALGIDGVGTSVSKTISNKFLGDINEFYVASKMGFVWDTLEDVGDKTAFILETYMNNNLAEMKSLADEMNFIITEKNIATQNLFTDKTICVTGKLEHFNRDSINQKIESLGAKVTSGVSAKTDYLITNTPDSGSSKNVNAKKYGTQIITEDKFLLMIGEQL